MSTYWKYRPTNWKYGRYTEWPLSSRTNDVRRIRFSMYCNCFYSIVDCVYQDSRSIGLVFAKCSSHYANQRWICPDKLYLSEFSVTGTFHSISTLHHFLSRACMGQFLFFRRITNLSLSHISLLKILLVFAVTANYYRSFVFILMPHS